MAERKSREMPAELSQGAAQWSQWRETRKAGTRIPEPLWKLATELAGKLGLSRTAAALRVGYDALKKQGEARTGTASGTSAGVAAFVELSPASTASAIATGDCIMEFEKRSGARMRIRIPGTHLPDLAALSRSFWETA